MRWPTPITLIPFLLSTHSFIVSGNRHPRAKTIPLPAALIISGIRSTATTTSSFVGPMRTAITVIQSSGSCSVIFRGKRRSACRGCLRVRSTSIRPAEDAQSTSATATQVTNDDDDEDKPTYVKVHARILPESEWRNRVDSHSKTVKSLLSPGLLPSPSGSGSSRNRKSGLPNASKKNDAGIGSGLDPKHPIYNFLIEYYGLKGSKGVRRLMRWSPPPFYADEGSVSCDSSSVSLEIPIRDSSGVSFPAGENGAPSVSGVILENATLDDVVVDGALHLRGATFLSDAARISGILYCPALYFGSKDPSVLRPSEERDGRPPASAAAFLWYRSLLRNTVRSEPVLYCHGLHEWAMLYRPTPNSPPPPSSQYQSHLPLRVSQETINEQVERKGVRCTHIDALRFFAPEARKWNRFGRLDEATNDTDDDGGTMEECHDDDNSGGGGFDADEVAAPDNGAKLSRVDQLRLEQKACLHANMDLLKMALRLQPFVSSELLIGALSVALRARTLDVEASPYDVSGYEGLAWGDVGCGEGRIAKETTRRLGTVEVETEEGRKLYQKRQMDVMKEGEIVRNELLRAYNSLLEHVFGIDEHVEIDETNE